MRGQKYTILRKFTARGKTYEIGTEAPEAAKWPTIRALIGKGWIKVEPIKMGSQSGAGESSPVAPNKDEQPEQPSSKSFKKTTSKSFKEKTAKFFKKKAAKGKK